MHEPIKLPPGHHVGSILPGHYEGNAHHATAHSIRECAVHGPYESLLWELRPHHVIAQPFWSQCPTCDAEIAAEQARWKDPVNAKAAFRARLKDSGIPERYLDCTVWNWQHGLPGQRRAWDWASDYCNHFELALVHGRSAMFVGTPGTGKTHLAIGVLRHVLEKGGTGLYVTVMGMLSRIKNTYHREAKETEQFVVKQLSSVDLLVIDEVGKTLDTNYESAQFFALLDRRYGHQKPVILVGNLTVEQMRAHLGGAAVDRLREGGGKMLKFDWASQRDGRKRKEDSDG